MGTHDRLTPEPTSTGAAGQPHSITVLLGAPLELEALPRLLARRGLGGATLGPPGPDGARMLRLGALELRLVQGPASLLRDRLAGLRAPRRVSEAEAFLELTPTVASRRGDPWAAEGWLRHLSRLVRALVEEGPGVLLPGSGVARERDLLVTRLGDLDDSSRRPFGAWMDWALDSSRHRYLSRGLAMQGLPELELEVDAEDAWALDRAHEALLLAAHRMVHENRALAPGERLEVPVGLQVGPGPLAIPPGDAERYEVRAHEGRIELIRSGPPGGTRALWKVASDPEAPDASRIGLVTYQELLRAGFATAHRARLIKQLLPASSPGMPSFTLDVMKSGSTIFLLTNGLGRERQPGGRPAQGTAHVELLATVEESRPLFASVLARLAAHVHRHDGREPFRPGDLVPFEIPALATAGFTLADAGEVPMGEGLPVHLLELIPLSEDEYATARVTGTEAILDEVSAQEPEERTGRWTLQLS